jgi:hypothetical protein
MKRLSAVVTSVCESPQRRCRLCLRSPPVGVVAWSMVVLAGCWPVELTAAWVRSIASLAPPLAGIQQGVPPSRPPLVSRPLPLSPVGQRVTGRTVSCSSRTREGCDSSRGEFGLVSRQHGDGDRLQSFPAPPLRRATSCRALVDHVPDHPAQGEEQPAQPRKALATAPRTPGGERAHRQPDRRQAKRPNARSTHPSTLPSPGADGTAGPGPAADRGSLERREDVGCVAVQRTGRRPAAGVELETFGGLERSHVGCRCARLPRS